MPENTNTSTRNSRSTQRRFDRLMGQVQGLALDPDLTNAEGGIIAKIADNVNRVRSKYVDRKLAELDDLPAELVFKFLNEQSANDFIAFMATEYELETELGSYLIVEVYSDIFNDDEAKLTLLEEVNTYGGEVV